MSNKVDFLSPIGVGTGNVIRYVKSAKNLTSESIAELLGISIAEEKNMEHLCEPLPEQWRLELRCCLFKDSAASNHRAGKVGKTESYTKDREGDFGPFQKKYL